MPSLQVTGDIAQVQPAGVVAGGGQSTGQRPELPGQGCQLRQASSHRAANEVRRRDS